MIRMVLLAITWRHVTTHPVWESSRQLLDRSTSIVDIILFIDITVWFGRYCSTSCKTISHSFGISDESTSPSVRQAIAEDDWIRGKDLSSNGFQVIQLWNWWVIGFSGRGRTSKKNCWKSHFCFYSKYWEIILSISDWSIAYNVAERTNSATMNREWWESKNNEIHSSMKWWFFWI